MTWSIVSFEEIFYDLIVCFRSFLRQFETTNFVKSSLPILYCIHRDMRKTGIILGPLGY